MKIENLINKIHCCDCLLAMREMPDECVDLVLTDPPYLQDSHGRGGAFGNRMRKYHDGVDELGFGYDNNWLEEIIRICKKLNIYIFCNKNQILQLLTFFKNYKYDLLVYIKTNPCPTCNNKYLSDIEYIIYIRESGVKLLGNYHSKKKWFLQQNGKSDFKHPTVKPLNIIKTLIKNSSNENNLVFDPFIGSGTTAVVCKQLNRKFIGCEISEEYCKIANERLKNIQMPLL